MIDNFRLRAIAAFHPSQRFYAVVGLWRNLVYHPAGDRRAWPLHGTRKALLVLGRPHNALWSWGRLWLLHLRGPERDLALVMLSVHGLRVILRAWPKEYMVLLCLPASSGEMIRRLLRAWDTVPFIFSEVLKTGKRRRFSGRQGVRWGDHEIGELGLALVEKSLQVGPLGLVVVTPFQVHAEVIGGFRNLVACSCAEHGQLTWGNPRGYIV